MKKKINLFILLLTLVFINVVYVSAEIIDPGTSGSSGSLGTLDSGSWNTQYVGMKVSIISSSGTLKEVEIILNQKCDSCLYSNNNKPKILQDSTITWKKLKYKNVESDMLGSQWTYTENGTTKYYSLSNILEKNKYENLNAILDDYFDDIDLANDDYILIEPMTNIGGYYGTAYELGNAFLTLSSDCKSTNNFCWMYSGAVFGGSNSKSGGGLFWNTIYYGGSKLEFGSKKLYKFTTWCNDVKEYSSCGSTAYDNKHRCLKGKYCGRGIGVYKYADIRDDVTKTLTITKKDSVTDEVIKGAGFELYSKENCKTKIKNEVKTDSKGTITFKDLEPGTYYLKESTIPSGYVTPSNRCTAVTVTKNGKNKKTIKNTPKGSLIINKTNSSNDLLASLTSTTIPKFKLYTNSSCSGTPLNDFVPGTLISNLTPGTYYLKEYQTKRGYHLPQKGELWYCTGVTVSAGVSATINVQNKTECEYRFKSDMKMKERIDLYTLIKTSYSQEFNALLNMDNKTAATACKNIQNPKTYNSSCLATTSSTSSSSFSDTNVSMYTEKYGSYTFCLTKYNLKNNLGKWNFGTIKSGQSIINTDTSVATATLNRVCYNFGDATIADAAYNNFSYANYVDSGPSLGGENLIMRSNVPTGTINNKTITVEYGLPSMYASNKDGKIYYNYCPTGQYCKGLGNGIISKFNSTPGTYNLNFNIKLNSSKLGSQGTSSNCSYSIENELVDYESKLNIEFRSVNTNSDALFLSKDGSRTRKIGANWDSIEALNVLKEKNNSYNKNRETKALYVVNLTPERITGIRQENKGKPYDDYNLNCIENGSICISEYLTDLQDRGILTINRSEKREKFN